MIILSAIQKNRKLDDFLHRGMKNSKFPIFRIDADHRHRLMWQ